MSVDLSEAKHPFACDALWVVRGNGVYLLTAIRWISSHALKCPYGRSGENESWESVSQSFSQGHWCSATFYVALPTVTISAETIAAPIQFGPASFLFSLLQCRRLHSLTFVLPCWKQSMNWWPYESQKSPANHCGKSHTSTLSMTAGFFPAIFSFSFFSLCPAHSHSLLPTSTWGSLRAANFSRIVFMCC